MAKEGEGKKTKKDDRYERVIKSYEGRDRLSLKFHTSPLPNPWGRALSPSRPHGLGAGGLRHFRLRQTGSTE